MHRYSTVIGVATLSLLSASCGMFQRAMPSTLSDANMMSVMNTVDRGDIEGGHLAQAKSSNPKVQAFGRQMVTDHSAMLQQNKELAQRLHITPTPPALSETLMDEHSATMNILRNKSGADFDRAYIDHEIEMHEQAVSLVEKSASAANDRSLKQHLEKAKPQLQSHLEAARNIKRSLTGQTD